MSELTREQIEAFKTLRKCDRNSDDFVDVLCDMALRSLAPLSATREPSTYAERMKLNRDIEEVFSLAYEAEWEAHCRLGPIGNPNDMTRTESQQAGLLAVYRMGQRAAAPAPAQGEPVAEVKTLQMALKNAAACLGDAMALVEDLAAPTAPRVEAGAKWVEVATYESGMSIPEDTTVVSKWINGRCFNFTLPDGPSMKPSEGAE